jgi:Fic-DOC domain mobile mystery protein B
MKIDPGWSPIPGETPIDDVSGLIPKIGTRSQLNAAESENIAAVVTKYLVGRFRARLAPFTFDWMLGLHGEMFGKVWKWAGKPRTCNLNLGCPFHDVEAELMNLAADMAAWETTPEGLLRDAATVHHRAVKIHPFLNGNGRWSRMLANIWLRKHGRRPTVWPEPEMGTDSSGIRAEYLEAIKAADALDYRPLIALHERYSG